MHECAAMAQDVLEELLYAPLEEDLLPTIAALYLSSPANSEYGDATEQDHDREWREAIRTALEEDLQRQVRLRLGLTSPDPSGSSHQPHLHLPSLVHHRHLHPSHSHSLHPSHPHTHTSHPHNLPTSQGHVITDAGQTVGGVGVKGGWRVVKAEKGQGEKGGGAPERRSHPSKAQEKMDIYGYLSSKYGTPGEQLNQLVTQGTFSVTQRKEGGNCVRSPVEANILLPTPNHICPVRPDGNPVKPVRPVEEPLYQPSPPSSSEDLVAGHGRHKSCSSGRGGQVVFTSSCTELGAAVAGRNGRLRFESRFESGNLRHAMQTGPQEYRLHLRTDLYSNRHTQWFYFQVTGMEAGHTYTFHITNFVKKDSLYNYGMQPLLYSEAEAIRGRGWRRVGRGIHYYRQEGLYCLTWRMDFPCSGDTCYLAYCYPYTYSHLLRYLDTVERERGNHIRREVLCHTLAGNPCYLLTVTDFEASPEAWSSRGGVVISARVHPGETNSSWMMEGLIDFLTSDRPHAKSLRSNYVFKILPMLNPDGVIVGNYRTSLAGVDLNRVYKRPVENLFPTVYHTKNMVSAFRQERELLLYVDLHGHSHKHNVFMYGCHVPNCDHTHFLNERVIPFLLSQQSPDKFSFSSCKFTVQRCKEATGRVVTWRMGVANSFTLESTFCGSDMGNNSRQFCETDLLAVGHDLCEAVHRYHKFKTSKSYQQKVLAELAGMIMARLAPDHPPQPSTPPPAPLPDIITSSTPHTVTLTAPHQPKSHSKSLRSRQAKILHRFSKLDMAVLEVESSTSGSDSENDEFEFYKKSHGSKHRHHRKHRSVPPQHLTYPAPPPSHASSLPHHASRPTRLAPLKLRASAPARMQATSTTALTSRKVLPPGYRFVNRYANRSNCGIPMFSEERLKERAEKRLRSLSMIQPPTEPRPPEAPPPGVVPHPHTATKLLLKTQSFLWRPDDSKDEGGQRQIAVSLRHRLVVPPPPSLPSSLHHYQTIKSLVERQRRMQAPRQLGGGPTASGPAHWPHPLQQMEGSQLSKYISEIWHKETKL